jgi:hypothetical protein
VIKSEATGNNEVPDAAQKPANRSLRAAKLVGGGIVFLALVYVALLIPEPRASVSRGAGRQPFIWKQDPFWFELEKKFNQARAEGCQTLLSRIDIDLAAIQSLLGQCSGKPLAPEDSVFAGLETDLFRLAPLVAACPQRLNEYITLATRARSEVKIQSQYWDLNAASTRQRLYRLLFGTRMALEEVMLQAPPSVEIPQSIPGSDVASRTPSVRLLGITLHSGDILVSRGGAPTSALIARGNDYPGSFSHVALLHVDEKSGQAAVIESHIERGVAVASLEEYLADKKLRIVVLRLRADLPEIVADPMLPHKAAASAMLNATSRHIPYDFAMDYQDHGAQFCSEVVSAAYEPTGVRLWKGMTFISSPAVAGWLGSVGVRHFETQEPADLEYDSQLCVVAEWRDRNTLFKAHVDDAVTDVMLEEAKPGEPLPYQPGLLPVTRLAKAYSFILNRLGKIGPIPEGMSATTALRVQKFRNDHAARARRVLQQAEEFKRTKGYTPPFWELTKMVQQAKPEPR